MSSRAATRCGKCEARKLRAVDGSRIPIVPRPRVYNYINRVNSLSASTRAAGSGVGCIRLVNNAALDSRTQFPHDVEAPQAKCEETRVCTLEKFPLFRDVTIRDRVQRPRNKKHLVYRYNVFVTQAVTHI